MIEALANIQANVHSIPTPSTSRTPKGRRIDPIIYSTSFHSDNIVYIGRELLIDN